jgi:zinc protease
LTARGPALGAGLAPVRTVLGNEAVFLAKETTTTPAVAISLAMRAGSAADPAGAEGAMWLLSRVIDRGTDARTATQIAEDLDGRGITLSISVTRHLFSVVCTCLSEDFEPVLALLGEILATPSLPASEIATRKGEVITAIRQDDDNPAVRANDALMARLYPGGHPYGRRTKGSVEIVERLTRDDLVRLHAAHFAPGNLLGVVVGDIAVNQAQDAFARVFGVWRGPAPARIALPPVEQAASRDHVVIPMMNKSQADIAYGFTAIARHDPDYYACWLMNNAFGQYAIGGRLGDSIRERQGMAYYVSSSLDANVAAGPLAIRAGVNPSNVERAIASIDEEILRLVADGLTPKELDESRRFLIGSMPRALETNASIANFLQSAEFFGLGLDYDLSLPGRLGAVTLEAANAAARRILAVDRATVVVAGPYGGRESFSREPEEKDSRPL